MVRQASARHEDSFKRTIVGSPMPRNSETMTCYRPQTLRVLADPTTRNNDSAVNHFPSAGQTIILAMRVLFALKQRGEDVIPLQGQ
jgi:hypothetical protein